VDTGGTFSETKRQMGPLRMMQAGVILSDYATLMIEVLSVGDRDQLIRVKSGFGNLKCELRTEFSSFRFLACDY
jgi:hypothetical protein